MKTISLLISLGLVAVGLANTDVKTQTLSHKDTQHKGAANGNQQKFLKADKDGKTKIKTTKGQNSKNKGTVLLQIRQNSTVTADKIVRKPKNGTNEDSFSKYDQHLQNKTTQMNSTINQYYHDASQNRTETAPQDNGKFFNEDYSGQFQGGFPENKTQNETTQVTLTPIVLPVNQTIVVPQ